MTVWTVIYDSENYLQKWYRNRLCIFVDPFDFSVFSQDFNSLNWGSLHKMRIMVFFSNGVQGIIIHGNCIWQLHNYIKPDNIGNCQLVW